MATADDRIDDLKDVVEDINGRVRCLENKLGDTREDALKSKKELSDLIYKAVKDGNKETDSYLQEMQKTFKKLDERVSVLEHAEADKALKQRRDITKLIMTGIISTVVGWVVLGFLNNYASITSDKIRNEVETGVIINETIKEVA